MIDNDYFKNGTYIIDNPGVYILTEDIIFEPNKFNNCKPTKNQRESGPYSHSDYIFGFFACIHIKCSDVILNLNGYSIEMSKLYRICQRFGSIISIGEHPFEPKQGPGGKFVDIINPIHNITIMGNDNFCEKGYISNSVHHCIRANRCYGLNIVNLSISNFEVAGIHLSGCSKIFINNVSIYCSSQDVILMGRYSQLQFCNEILIKLEEKFPSYEFETHIGNFKIKDLITENLKLLNEPIKCLKENITYNGIFKRKLTIPEGNLYGIIITSPGVIIGNKKIHYPDKYISDFIYIDNIKISNLISKADTIKAFETKCCKDDLLIEEKHNGCPCSKIIYKDWIKLNSGSGDMLNPEHCTDIYGLFTHDNLCTSQLLIQHLTKLHPEIKSITRTTIGSCILYEKWVKSGNKLETVLNNHKDMIRLSEDKIDIMAHIIKDNFGILIQQSKNIYLNKINICNIINHHKTSTSIGLEICGSCNIFINQNYEKNIYNIIGDQPAGKKTKFINCKELYKFNLCDCSIYKIESNMIEYEIVKDEIVKNEIVEDEIVKDEIVKDEIVKNEIVKDEIVKNEIVEDEIVKNEIVKDEIVKNEIVEDEIVKDEIKLKNNTVSNSTQTEKLISIKTPNRKISSIRIQEAVNKIEQS